ncbi:hypothetical protein TWF481_007844 [Arthrobotrys musiformis]|uniref:CST complex subunit Stn1 N-terminal domain-containing protein n=1 Tax=Arthrobotrys musiformis TaxID=47236 RepID=A0AAV9WB59_9PEZI
MPTPLPSPVHFIQNVHHLPVGCKVRVLGLIQSYEPSTGIMTLHHRPAIDIPPPTVSSALQRQRKRKVVGEGEGVGGKRVLAVQPTSSHVAPRNGAVQPEGRRRIVNGPSGIQSASRMSAAGSTSNRPANGVTRSTGTATGTAKIPPRVINPPQTPTKGRIVHLVTPSSPLSPIKPLVAASQAAVSALNSVGMNKRPSLPLPKPAAVTIPPPPPPKISPILPRQPSKPAQPPKYTLEVSIDLTLRTTTADLTPLPPIIEGTWVNVIGYKRGDGVVDAISIFKVEGKLNIEAYERAIEGMGKVRERVEWEVREGIANGRGLQGGVWD